MSHKSEVQGFWLALGSMAAMVALLLVVIYR